jgi:hypothetical protein
MRKLALLLLLGVWTVGCGDNDDDDLGQPQPPPETPPPTTPPPTPPPSTPRMWHANIVGNDIYGSLAGEGFVTELGDNQGFTATVELHGDIPGTVRPWHVHVGSCGTPGAPIVGADTAYPRLQTTAEGTSAATVNINVPLDSGAYLINIHESDAQFGTLIACGNLIRQ